MDYELIRNGLTLGNLLLTLIFGIIAIDARKGRATAEALNALTTRLNAKCEKIARLEAELNALPTRQEVVRIHERIDGKFADIDGRLERIQMRMDENAKANNLLLGQLLGRVEQINERSTV